MEELKVKHPIKSQRNWVFSVSILMTILLLVYPMDLLFGRITLGVLGLSLFYGWRRNWLQHVKLLKWFDNEIT